MLAGVIRRSWLSEHLELVLVEIFEQIHTQTDRQTDTQTDRHAHTLPHMHTHTHTHTRTQTDTHTHTRRQTGRHTHRHRDTHTTHVTNNVQCAQPLTHSRTLTTQAQTHPWPSLMDLPGMMANGSLPNGKARAHVLMRTATSTWCVRQSKHEWQLMH